MTEDKYPPRVLDEPLLVPLIERWQQKWGRKIIGWIELEKDEKTGVVTKMLPYYDHQFVSDALTKLVQEMASHQKLERYLENIKERLYE